MEHVFNPVLEAIKDAHAAQVKTGSTILEAKQRLPKEVFEKLLNDLPFSRREAKRLMILAVKETGSLVGGTV